MFRTIRLAGSASAFLSLLIAGAAPSTAQDPAASAAPATAPTSQPDWATLPLAELELRLMPLRKAELTKEAELWVGRLQTKVAELCETETAARHADVNAKPALLTRAGTLRTERTALLDRVNLVVGALKDKGGDVAEYEKYIPAVSGVRIDVTDTAAATSVVWNWIKSPEGGLRWVRNIVLFVVTLVVARVIANIVSRIIERALRSVRTMSGLLRNFFANVTRQVISLVGLVVALSMLEVNIGPMVAAIGAVGFIVGFALQGTLSNFAAGVMILLYRPYDVGDEISVGTIKGRVEAMTLVSTSIINAENQHVIAPNNAIWGGVITNLSARRTAGTPAAPGQA